LFESKQLEKQIILHIAMFWSYCMASAKQLRSRLLMTAYRIIKIIEHYFSCSQYRAGFPDEQRLLFSE
jgi:hypothetical protein